MKLSIHVQCAHTYRKASWTHAPNPTGSRLFAFLIFTFGGHFEFFSLFCLVFEWTPPRDFIGSASKLVGTVMKWCWTKIMLFVIVRWRACRWHAVKVGHFWIPCSYFHFFALYLNELLLGNLSDLLQNWSVQSWSGAKPKSCYLWLYVEGRVRGMLSKLAIFEFRRVVFELTPPREFIGSASNLVSTVMKWCWTKIVLFGTVRWRACPWRDVKVGHFEWNFTFSHCIWTNSS